MTTLSVYFDPQHDREGDKEYIQQLQPAWVRIHQVTARSIAEVQRLAPDAKIMLRRWEIDDNDGERKQEVYRDPKAAALKHAYAWDDAIADMENELHRNGWAYDKTKWYVGLLNEPDPNHLKQVIEYTAESIRLADLRGRRLGVLVPSVGNFGKPGEANSWDMCKPLEKAINDGGHILIVHEYWQPEGVAAVWTDAGGTERHDAGNLAWRHHIIPLNVPILVGEAGANGYIYNRHSQTDDAGWQKFMTPEQYAAQVQGYIAGCDKRVQGVCLYLTDFHGQWWSFDTERAHGALLAIKDVAPQVESPFAKPNTVHLPIVENGGGNVSAPLPQGVIDPQVLEAILQIESGGQALSDDGRPIIRFEAHIFKQQLGNDALFAQHFRYGQPVWTQRSMNDGSGWKSIEEGGQARQWEAFDLAASLNYEAAAQSISMGAPQIMGFNHASIGYPSATAMLEAFGSEPVQIIAFINFILGRASLASAVRNKDWREVARIYNGSGNVDHYASLLQGAYNKIAGKA